MSQCLELVAYDTDEAQATVVVPLPASLGSALPGAPTACVSGDGTDVIDDTAKISFRPSVPKGIQEEITAYFRDNPFKSFASVRIIGAGVAVGVVNVDARATHVFGQSVDEKQSDCGVSHTVLCHARGCVFAVGRGEISWLKL